MNERTWPCEHIFRSDDGRWLLKRGDGLDLVHHNWDKCPVRGCDAKRPEEPKALWKTIGMNYCGCDGLNKRDALAALKWFKGNLPVLEKCPEKQYWAMMDYQRDIVDWIDKEIDKCKEEL